MRATAPTNIFRFIFAKLQHFRLHLRVSYKTFSVQNTTPLSSPFSQAYDMSTTARIQSPAYRTMSGKLTLHLGQKCTTYVHRIKTFVYVRELELVRNIFIHFDFSFQVICNKRKECVKKDSFSESRSDELGSDPRQCQAVQCVLSHPQTQIHAKHVR